MAMWLHDAGELGGPVFIAALAGIVVGLFMFVRGFSFLKKRRLIENTPTSKARSAALGMVELNGTAAGPYTLTAPLSLQPCFYFRLVVERRAGRNSWRKELDKRRSIPFYLKDETGAVLVDTRGAEIDLPSSFQTSSPFGEEGEEADAGEIMTGARETRAREYCICEGQPLYILGSLTENPGIEVIDPGPSLPVVSSSVRAEIMSLATARPAQSQPSGEAFDRKPAVVLRRGERDDHLFISTRSERELLADLSGKCALWIWGGPFVTMAGVAYVLWRTGGR